MWYPGRGSSPWALSLLALGGGVRMAISRSIRATSVGKIKTLYVRGMPQLKSVPHKVYEAS